jgi:hypothetical protein
VAASVPGGRAPRLREHRQERAVGRGGGLRGRSGPVLEALESRLLLSLSPVTSEANLLGTAIVPKAPVDVQSLTGITELKPLLGSGSVSTSSMTSLLETSPASNPVSPLITIEYGASAQSGSHGLTLVSVPVVSTPPQAATAAGYDQSTLNPEDAELTYTGLGKLPTIPMMGDVTVAGSLVPQQTWSTFKIPVDPATQSLNLTVRPDPAPAAPLIAALDQLYLVGPTGNLMAKLTGASTYAQGPEQDVSVSLSRVPVGSDLVVRIVETPLATAPTAKSLTAASSAQPAGATSLPFTMEVTRSEPIGTSIASPGFGGSVAGSFAESLTIGYAPITSVLAVPGADLADVSSTADMAGAGRPENLAGKAPAPSPATQPVEETWIAPPVVSVGPLVSRGSAPLGPMLGTTAGEPTPEIDRAERAFDLTVSGSWSIAASRSDLLNGLANRLDTTRPDGTHSWRPEEVRSSGESFVSLRGPGGFPALGTRAGGDQGESNPEAILATVATVGGADDPCAATAHKFIRSTSEFARLDPRARDEFVHTDFFTVTCSLVLGISLTAGPFYPDLMPLVRNWLPGRGRRSRHGSSPGSPARPGWWHPACWFGFLNPRV